MAKIGVPCGVGGRGGGVWREGRGGARSDDSVVDCGAEARRHVTAMRDHGARGQSLADRGSGRTRTQTRTMLLPMLLPLPLLLLLSLTTPARGKSLPLPLLPDRFPRRRRHRSRRVHWPALCSSAAAAYSRIRCAPRATLITLLKTPPPAPAASPFICNRRRVARLYIPVSRDHYTSSSSK